jgi:hypothetical protein
VKKPKKGEGSKINGSENTQLHENSSTEILFTKNLKPVQYGLKMAETCYYKSSYILLL